ncbi:glyoxylate/hydroxypyruvate reductase A [Niveibacterium umoris]|uniref:Glyoxylate/hydroxypyruvate reductase A n=1 Tax=Niveibacterium umoris TaxID=1193620 RepID=A0A840BQL4_9RHOO|nr:glyoxylate/hydroxypyruvate reductase A [Niveibacterium umoris]MBB4013962.1 glyoxylate/hydroxypyruvate reductase A [Niveibacterium umoris]
MSIDLVVAGGYSAADWQAGFDASGASIKVHEAAVAPPCRYALVWGRQAALYASQPALEAVFSMGAGVEHLLGDPALPPNLPLIRLEDAGMAPQMAAYAVWGVLRHLRQFDASAAAARRGEDWGGWRSPPATGARVGVMGLGVMGQAVLAALAPLGFTLRGWGRSPRDLPGVACHAGADALDVFLDQLDALVCVLPHTADTVDLLNTGRLARLAPGALVLNAGRGSLIVEADLLAALDSGRLGAAVLDVFREEPLPAGHPFLSHPRVTVTPHIAARTQIPLTAEQVTAKIARLEAGLPVSGVVDRVRGY